MNSSDKFARVTELAMQQLSGDLAAADWSELEQLVLSDESARLAYVEYIRDSSQLRWLHAEESRSAVSCELSATLDTHPTPRSRSWLNHASRHPLAPSIGIAMMIFVALFVGMAVTPVREWIADSENKNDLKPAAEPAFVARLSDWHDAVWLEKTRPPLRDPRLNVGKRLLLASGVIEIKYNTGARIVIEGPAEFVIGTKADGNKAEGNNAQRHKGTKAQRKAEANAGFLRFGKLTARVEGKEAKGFTIDTPRVHVEDLGTEFGIEVHESGESELHVFDGKVEAAIVDADGKFVRRHEFIAGQAARITSGARRFARFDADEVRFSRIPETTQQLAPSNEIRRLTVQYATYSATGRHRDRMVDGSGMRTGGGHDTEQTNQWDSGRHDGMEECAVEFDLGGVYRLDRIHVWNWNNRHGEPLKRGAKDVEILVARTDGGQFESIGMFEFTIASGVEGDKGFDIANFPANVVAHDVRFRITTNFVGPFGTETKSGHDRVGIAEVHFYGTPPPAEEPDVAGAIDEIQDQE